MITFNTKCPIWGTDAKLIAPGEVVHVLSLRAGGEYRIEREVREDHSTFTLTERTKLTTWLVDQRRLGEPAPLISSRGLDAILARRPLRVSEKRERLLKACAGIRVDAELYFTDDVSGEDSPFHPARLLAAMGADSVEEADGIARTLQDDGLARIDKSGCVAFTSRGHAALEDMESKGDSTQAFVAMWFDPSMKEAWRLGFAPAIRDAGYTPFRIDGLQHNGKIDDAIVAEIKKSRFLVADFTCGGEDTPKGFQPSPRGGVYYEAGLGHGLGMEVIFTCQEDSMAWLHFDTRQFAHIVWKTPADLRDQLYNRIAATLKEAPGAPGRGKGSVDPPSAS